MKIILMMNSIKALSEKETKITEDFDVLVKSIGDVIEILASSMVFWCIVITIFILSIYAYRGKKSISFMDSILEALSNLIDLFLTVITDVIQAFGVIFHFIKLLMELFFGNLTPRVVRKLSTYGIIFLSLVSYITTYNGMLNLFEWYTAALVSFGVQALILVIASKIVLNIEKESDQISYDLNVLMLVIPLVGILLPISILTLNLWLKNFTISFVIGIGTLGILLIIYFKKINVKMISYVMVLLLGISISSFFSYSYIYKNIYENIEVTDNVFMSTKKVNTYIDELNPNIKNVENIIYNQLNLFIDVFNKEATLKISYDGSIKQRFTLEEFIKEYDLIEDELNKEKSDLLTTEKENIAKIIIKNQLDIDELTNNPPLNLTIAEINTKRLILNKEITDYQVKLDNLTVDTNTNDVINAYMQTLNAYDDILKNQMHTSYGQLKDYYEDFLKIKVFVSTKKFMMNNTNSEEVEEIFKNEIVENSILLFGILRSAENVEIFEEQNVNDYRYDAIRLLLYKAFEIQQFYDKYNEGFSNEIIQHELINHFDNKSVDNANKIVEAALRMLAEYPDITDVVDIYGATVLDKEIKSFTETENKLLDMYRTVNPQIHKFEKNIRRITDFSAYPLMAIFSLFIALILDIFIVELYFLRGKKGFKDSSLTCARIIYKHAVTEDIAPIRTASIRLTKYAGIIAAIICLILLVVNPFNTSYFGNSINGILVFFLLDLSILAIIGVLKSFFSKNNVSEISTTKFIDKDEFYNSKYFEEINYKLLKTIPDGVGNDNYYGYFVRNIEKLREKFCDAFVFLLLNIEPNNIENKNHDINLESEYEKEGIKEQQEKYNDHIDTEILNELEIKIKELNIQIKTIRNMQINSNKLYKKFKKSIDKNHLELTKININQYILNVINDLSGIGTDANNYKEYFYNMKEILNKEFEDKKIDGSKYLNIINNSMNMVLQNSLNLLYDEIRRVKDELKVLHEERKDSFRNIEKSVINGKKNSLRIIGSIDNVIIEKTGYSTMMLALLQYEVVEFSRKENKEIYYIKGEFIRIVNQLLIGKELEVDPYEEDEEDEFDEI